MMEPGAGLGPRLKAERERRGLTPQKAADELHLDGWVINALEAEDYDRVGPAVYVKGHLKRYAALLGLPPAEIMASYESLAPVPAPPAPAAQPANVRLRTDTPAVSNLPWPQIAGAAAVALLVLGVLWWKPWHQRGTAPVTSAPVAAQPVPLKAENADPGHSEITPPGAASRAPSTAAATVAAVPAIIPSLPSSAAAQTPAPAAVPGANGTAGVGRARLRLSFSADSWVDVHDAEGRRAFAGNGRANTVRTISGSAPMRVYLRFASGVQLEINNRAVAIGPQFMARDAARFEAGADGILRRDTHAPPPGAANPGATAPGQSRNARPTG